MELICHSNNQPSRRVRLSLTFLPPVDTHQQFIRSLDGERPFYKVGFLNGATCVVAVVGVAAVRPAARPPPFEHRSRTTQDEEVTREW